MGMSKKQMLLRFLLPLVAIVPIVAIFAGYGEPYGIEPSMPYGLPAPSMPSMPQSFWPFWQAERADGGFDDVLDLAESGELAGVDSEEPAEEPDTEIPVEAPEQFESEEPSADDA